MRDLKDDCMYTNEDNYEFIIDSQLGSSGLQSQIELGRYAGHDAIRKTFGRNLTPSEREEIISATSIYRHQLLGVGINIPRLYNYRLSEGGIETIEEFIGRETLEHLIKSGVRFDLWDNMLRQVCGINDGKSSRTKVMLDVRPGNWIPKDNNLYFVDLYPPPLRGSDGQVYPWIASLYKRSRDLFTFNYGDSRGQLTRLLLEVSMIVPNNYTQIKDRSLDIFKDLLPINVYEYIRDQVNNNFSDMRLLYFDPDNSESKLNELLGK